MKANFDIMVYIVAREKMFLPCTKGRAQYDVWQISNNAGRASVDVIIYRRWPIRYGNTQKKSINKKK